MIPEDPPPPGTPTNADGSIAGAGAGVAATARVGNVTRGDANSDESLEPGGFLREGDEGVVEAFLLKSRVTKSDAYHRQQGKRTLRLYPQHPIPDHPLTQRLSSFGPNQAAWTWPSPSKTHKAATTSGTLYKRYNVTSSSYSMKVNCPCPLRHPRHQCLRRYPSTMSACHPFNR